MIPRTFAGKVLAASLIKPICAGRRRRAETTTGTSNGWRSDSADATARYRYETHVRASEDACDPTTESRRLAPRMR